MTAPPFTTAEGEALRDALSQWFGPCICNTTQVIKGTRIHVQQCAGHAFLSEPRRLELLLGLRRDKERLLREEHGRDRPLPVLPW